jgi:KDO2-lipid IV(A) lauroyltransferase
MPVTEIARPPGREKSRKKSAFRRSAERLFTRAATSVFSSVIRAIPLAWGRGLANLYGYLLYALTLRRQRLADRNLVATFGDRFTARERRRIRLAVTQNMCKVFVELFKASRLAPEQIRDLIPAEGLEHLQQAVARGKGIMAVTGHFGSWELLGARLTAEGIDLGVVARDASDAGVASLINDARERLGMKVFGKRDLKAMTAHLRANGALGILPDQHARKGSILLDFLGRPAWVVRSPALMALRTGAALIPTFCLRGPGDSLRVIVLPKISTEGLGDRDEATVELTRRINAALEEQIRAHPEQWLWLHNRWKPAAPEHEAKYLRREAEDASSVELSEQGERMLNEALDDVKAGRVAGHDSAEPLIADLHRETDEE